MDLMKMIVFYFLLYSLSLTIAFPQVNFQRNFDEIISLCLTEWLSKWNIRWSSKRKYHRWTVIYVVSINWLNWTSPNSTLNERIFEFYELELEITNLTCYEHLKCDRGSKSLCLDWTERTGGHKLCKMGAWAFFRI